MKWHKDEGSSNTEFYVHSKNYPEIQVHLLVLRKHIAISYITSIDIASAVIEKF